jgi:hypothetical protein
MITSKPANGAEGQDMKLFYRVGGSSGKFFFILLSRRSGAPRPAGGRKGAFVFGFKRFCLVW